MKKENDEYFIVSNNGNRVDCRLWFYKKEAKMMMMW